MLRSGFDSRRYQIFREVVDLDRSTKPAVGIRHADHVAPSIRKKLALTSPTSGSRSVDIVHSRTQAMEFVCSGSGTGSTQPLEYN
jgi:hypothetical protein